MVLVLIRTIIIVENFLIFKAFLRPTFRLPMSSVLSPHTRSKDRKIRARLLFNCVASARCSNRVSNVRW